MNAPSRCRGRRHGIAVPTSYRSLKRFAFRLRRMWLRVLRRRSQMDRTKLDKLGTVAAAFWPRLKILHPWPDARFAVTHPREEPDGLANTSGSARGVRSNAHSYRNNTETRERGGLAPLASAPQRGPDTNLHPAKLPKDTRGHPGDNRPLTRRRFPATASRSRIDIPLGGRVPVPRRGLPCRRPTSDNGGYRKLSGDEDEWAGRVRFDNTWGGEGLAKAVSQHFA